MDFITTFEMSSTTYDRLKYLTLIILPAIATFIGLIGPSIGWGGSDTVVTLITASSTLIGTILGVSNHNYRKYPEEI